MLIELAIGDAYGAGFEYVSNTIVKRSNNLSKYVQHPRHVITPGVYTDDTQMAIAIVELILSGEQWSPANICKYFIRAFKRDPREGYASRFFEFLSQIKNENEFLNKIHPVSEKSGAAMRAGPIGLYRNLNEVVKKSTIQAKTTHDTTLGINAAVAASLMVHYFRFELGAKAELGKFLEAHVEGNWNTPWNGKVGALGAMSVRAAVDAIKSSSSMKCLLMHCVNLTGDVDTVATIALAAACFSKEVSQDLPNHLYQNLEKTKYGYNFLKILDNQLLSKNL